MALYTKKLIMNTFQEMLEELSFDKITVSALVKRAGISPNTFYYHYQDIYALLDVWFREQMGYYAPQDKTVAAWQIGTASDFKGANKLCGEQFPLRGASSIKKTVHCQ